jgi:hypothetical protein
MKRENLERVEESAAPPKPEKKYTEVAIDTLESFQSLCRLRLEDGWILHSWNMFTEVRGGGRIGHYEQQMVASLWLEGGR